MTIDFDPDYASATQWARVYRACGFQVVPAKLPSEVKQGDSYKRPIIPWRQHEKELVSEEQFDEWYGKGGQHSSRMSMGVLTGSCSGNLFVIDLDTHKNPDASVWWEGIHADHTCGIFSETATQTTGGGGKQYFFRAPPGVRMPTVKTPIGVDFRGEGGFAMLPPSKHESGSLYAWDDGFEPYEIGVAEAPQWLLQEVAELAAKYGAGGEASSGGHKEKTPTPAHSEDAFGNIVDGREDYMHRMIFAAVLNAYRECPIPPSPEEQTRKMREAFIQYETHVKSRIREPGTPNHVLLEREGRGITLFTQKWGDTFAQWDKKVARVASEPAPKKDPPPPGGAAAGAKPPFAETRDDDGFGPSDAVEPEKDVYRLLSLKEILAMPDPVYLIENMIMEKSMSFIYGAPGIGKSFVAIGLALSVATGQAQWWGRKINRRGAVLYISSEGVSDIKLRVAAWSNKTGVPVDDDTIEFFLLDKSVNFMDPNSVNKLLRTIVDRYRNEPPALVVIDTVSRTLPGADENLQKDMTLYIQTCSDIQEAFDCTVMGVHHSSRGGGAMRGSTVFDGAADSVFQVALDEETGDKVLVAQKIKTARDGWREPFGLAEVIVGIGKSSLVAAPIPPQEASPDGFGGQQETGGGVVDGKRWPDMETCRKIVRDIGDAWMRHEPWSSNKQSRASGRYAADRIHEAHGVPRNIADMMVAKWLVNDVIEMAQYDSRTRKQGLRVKNGLP